MAYANPDFFVEDDEPQYTRLPTKEQIRIAARNRQIMIGEEMSRMASEEYIEDILQHMSYMEDETLPDVNLIDMQREIQWFMRPFLIDFLIEAHAAFQLQPETLFLTVNLLDRYCSKRVVYKQHYQLVGCAALLIAAKYGDKKDRVPQINELNNMCCGLYDAGMFTQMEMHVLNTLEWIIGHPTVDFFSQLIVAEEGDDREVEHMAAYICEIALYHRDFVSTKPSIMARSSLALARAILQRPEINDGEWDQTSSGTLRTLMQHLHQPSATLTRKYSASSMSRVAITLAEFLAHQAAISRRAEPPSPPTEPVLAAKSGNIYSTPSKGHGAMLGVADGYLTPPITPDGVHFGVSDPMNKYVPPRCPVTPSPPAPQTAAYPPQQPQQQHHMHQYNAYSSHNEYSSHMAAH